MKLYIDSAKIDEILSMNKHLNFRGVTTNPTLMARANPLNYFEHLYEIKNNLLEGQEFHVQTTESSAEEIIKNSREIKQKLGDNVYVKIPMTSEGVKAIKVLKKEGMKITATAVYSPSQVFIACNLGVDYIAPYLNRISNLSYDGAEVVARMQLIIDQFNNGTRMLAASFKNTGQLMNVAVQGAYSATISFDIFESLIENLLADEAVKDFITDFNSIPIKK